MTTVVFDATIGKADEGGAVPDAWYQVRKKIGDIRGSLPQGVVGPFFNDEFGDVYGSIYALSADGFSEEELRQFAEKVRSDMLRVPSVAKVELFGVQPEKVYVEIPQRRLAQLGIDMNQVVAQLNAQNAVEGAGVFNNERSSVQMRVNGAFNSIEQLRTLPIRVVNPANGQARSVKLGDVATIRRAYQDPPTTKVRHQGKQVIALGISMAKGGDIIELGKQLAPAIARIRANLPVGLELHSVADQPTVVKRSVREFMRTLIEAIGE